MTNHHEQQNRAVPAALMKLLSGRDALAQGFQQFQNSFHEEGLVDPRLLELCRARIDVLHGVKPDTPVSEGGPQIDAKEVDAKTAQLALSIAEQLAIDAHGVSDAQVAQLAAELGEPAAVALLTATSMHDATVRMQRILQPLAQERESTQDKGAH